MLVLVFVEANDVTLQARPISMYATLSRILFRKDFFFKKEMVSSSRIVGAIKTALIPPYPPKNQGQK